MKWMNEEIEDSGIVFELMRCDVTKGCATVEAAVTEDINQPGRWHWWVNLKSESGEMCPCGYDFGGVEETEEQAKDASIKAANKLLNKITESQINLV